MCKDVSWRRVRGVAGGRLCRPGGATCVERVVTAKEGAHGGTMGSPMQEQVEPRREFIEQNAKDVKFLDV